MNPHDDALLNDLLDERLTPAEEAAVSARLEREPALREAWDELVRARELLRSAPEPVPPADFVARVRARLAAASPASLDGEVEETPRADAPGVVPAPEESAARSGVPPAWRRTMTIAYAAAAALVLGIGLFAMRDGGRGAPAAPADRAPDTSLARTERSLERERAERGLEVFEGGAEGPVPERRDLRTSVPEPLAPAEKAAPAAGADGSAPDVVAGAREAGAKGAPAGRFGAPGGAVPPALRQPSDTPPPPAAPTPAPPRGAPRGEPAAGGTLAEDDKAPAGESKAKDAAKGPAQEDASAPAALADVLVLEAATLDAGRRILDSVLAGPGAAGSGGTGGAAPAAATVVALRRLDVQKDRALLPALSDRPVARLGAPASAPPPPTSPPTTPAPAEPAPAPPAAKPASPSAAAAVLGVEARTLSPEQWSRLEALLGPPAAKARKKEGAEADAGERAARPAPTSVRVLIVRPAAPAAR